MAATEEGLPEELDKLQITPNLSQVKPMNSNLSLALNPFFEADIKTISSVTAVADTSLSPKNVRVVACRRGRFRGRRASESVLDELKNSSGVNLEIEESRTSPMSGVLKQTLKKSSPLSAGNSVQRKLILREPVLKALQTCLHPQSNVQRSLLSSSAASQCFDLTSQSNDGPLAAKGINDFRDLIQECRSLLAEDVDFSCRLNQLSLSNRNSKNFTIMQTKQKPQSCGNKLRNNRTFRKEQQILDLSTTPEATGGGGCINDNHHNDLHVCQQLSLSLPRNNLSLSSSPEHAQTSARCSTSCSQQAGSTVSNATGDDVTIDELASYFDTFVHIPKKMSTMAEMMYI